MAIVNTKGRTNQYQSDQHHKSFGIQNWLCKKGFILKQGAKYTVDKVLYKELLKEFCLFTDPEFDFSKMKGIESMEKYVQNRFQKFCSFCMKKFKP